MRNVFCGEAHHALVHRLDRIGDDVPDRVGKSLNVDIDVGEVAGEKILGADHRSPQDAGDGFLHRRFKGDPHLGLGLLGGDREHLLDEIARALEGALHFIQSNGDGVMRAVQVFRDGEIADDVGEDLVEIAGHALDQSSGRDLGRSERERLLQLQFLRRSVASKRIDSTRFSGSKTPIASA